VDFGGPEKSFRGGLKEDFRWAEKPFPNDLKQRFFGERKSRSSATTRKSGFSGSVKVTFPRRPETAIFLRVEMSLFIGSQKQRFFGDRICLSSVAWISYLPGSRKDAQPWRPERANLGERKNRFKRRPERAIFLRVEKSLFIGSQKQLFFGERKCRSSATWISNFSVSGRVAFPRRPDKAKDISASIWKADCRGAEKSLIRAGLKELIFGER